VRLIPALLAFVTKMSVWSFTSYSGRDLSFCIQPAVTLIYRDIRHRTNSYKLRACISEFWKEGSVRRRFFLNFSLALQLVVLVSRMVLHSANTCKAGRDRVNSLV
jgi:hypothetical protein